MVRIRNCSRLLDLVATCCSSSWRPALTSLHPRDASDGTPPTPENVQLFPVQTGSLRGPRRQVQRVTQAGVFHDIIHLPPPQISMVGGEKVVVCAGCTLVASCFSLEVGWTRWGEFSCCCWVRQYYSPLQPHRLLKGGSRARRLCVCSETCYIAGTGIHVSLAKGGHFWEMRHFGVKRLVEGQDLNWF